jgi:uncharacterized protein
MTVKVNISGELPQSPVVIEAFPSKGYVSTLAANHLIKQLGMDLVGHIESDKLSAIAVVHDSKPMHPIRVYAKDELILIFSELMIPFSLVHEFTTSIGDWFRELNPKSAILLASVPGISTEKEHEILAVSTDERVKDLLSRLDVKEMDEGVLTGMSSSLMIKCCGFKIPATSLMVETNYIPDVLAAASLLKILSGVLGLDVNVDDLTKTGKEIEKKFKETLEQLKKGQQNIREIHQDLTMYR